MMLPTAGSSPGQTCGAVLAAAVLLQSVCVAVTFLYFTNELKQVGAGRDGARARRLCPLVRGSRGWVSVCKPRWVLWGAEEVRAAGCCLARPSPCKTLLARRQSCAPLVVAGACVCVSRISTTPCGAWGFLGCPTQNWLSCCTVVLAFASPGAKVNQAAGVCVTLMPCQKTLHKCKHILRVCLIFPVCLFHAKFNRWSLLKCQNSL